MIRFVSTAALAFALLLATDAALAQGMSGLGPAIGAGVTASQTLQGPQAGPTLDTNSNFHNGCGNGPLGSCLPTVQTPVVAQPQPAIAAQPAARAAQPAR